MKKILLYVVVTFVGLSVSAQSNDVGKKFKYLNKKNITSEKSITSIDTNYRALQKIYYYPDLDSNNIWVKSSVTTCSYDSLTSLLTFEIGKDPSNTTNQSKTTYSYDTLWNVTEGISQYWNQGDSTWINSYRFVNQYNSKNDQIENRSENWNMVTSAWKINYGNHTDYTYDDNNNKTIQISKNWVSHLNDFRNSSKTEDVFINNILTEEIFSKWDTLTGTWIPQDKYIDVTWHNFAAFMPEKYIHQIYANGGWIDNDRFTATFSGNDYVAIIDSNANGTWGAKNKEIYSELNNYGSSITTTQKIVSGNWVNENRYTTEYNNHKENIHSKGEIWLSNAWVTIYEYKTIITYDSGDNYILSKINQNWDSQQQQLRNSYKYEYNNYITIIGVQDVTVDSKMKIYPNPITSQMNIVVEKYPFSLEIYNIMGLQLWNKTYTNPENIINLSDFENGLYIIKIKTDNKIESKIVVKQE